MSEDNERKRSSLWRIVVPAVVILGAIAVVVWIGRKPSPTTDRESVVIAQAGDFFLYAPLYVAIDKGLLRDQGIDARIVSTGGDDKTWAAVISGDAQFGVADPTFIAIAAQRGQPGNVIATIVNGVPFWGVTYKEEISPFTTPSDLDGWSVATFSAPSTAYTLQRQMFVDAGLEPQIRQGAFGTILAMLRAQTADIGLELEPNVSQAVAGGAHVVYSLSDVYGDFAITGLTASPDYLDKHPDTAQRVVCALQHALDFMRQKPEEALNILLARFPELDEGVAQEAFRRVVDEKIIPETLVTSEEAWTKASNLRVVAGDLQSAAPFDTFVVSRFASWAAQHCRGDGAPGR